jgi:hypothetical protein
VNLSPARRPRRLAVVGLLAVLPLLAVDPAHAAVELPRNGLLSGTVPTDYSVPVTLDDWFTVVAVRPGGSSDWDLSVTDPSYGTRNGSSIASTGTEYVVVDTGGNAASFDAHVSRWSGTDGYRISRAGAGVGEFYDGVRLPAYGAGSWRTLDTARAHVRLVISDLCGDQPVRVSLRGSSSLSRSSVSVVAMPRAFSARSRAQAAYRLDTVGTATGTLNFDAAGTWRQGADYIAFVVLDEGPGAASSIKIEGGTKRSSQYVCPAG